MQMEEKLRRFHTSYDDSGRPSRQGIFETQRIRHQDSIAEFDSIQAFKEQHFTLRQLDNTFASTPAIVDHPKYKAIQKIFNSYNEQIKPYSGRFVDAFNTKKQIMDATMSMFRLMVLSPSVNSKVAILELTHEWVFKQLNPKQLRKPKRDLVQDLKLFLRKKKLNEVQNVDATLPSQKSQNDRQDYINQARTHHQDRDAPAFELEHYIVHKMNALEGKGNSLDRFAPQKQPKVIYSRPAHQQTISKNTQNSLNLSFTKAKIEHKQFEESTYRTEQHKLQALENEALVLELQREPIDQNNEALQRTDSNEIEVQQVLFEEREVKDNIEEEQEKKEKLEPETKAYISANLCDSLNIPLSISHRQQSMYHRTPFKNRQDSILLKRVSAWAGARSQFKTELARKIESNRTFFGQNKPQQRGQIHLEMQQMRINHALREGRKYLRQEQDFSKERLNSEPGLSVFSHNHNRNKIASVRSTKTFQSILKENSIHNTSEIMMEEVEELKSKLASKKVYVSMALLQKSMMPPEQIEPLGERVKTERPLFLLSNPLAKKKKKRRVTKKK